MRSFKLNLDFYKKLCDDSFGNKQWPKVERKNIEYGALSLKATNLLMVNGVEGIIYIIFRSLEMGKSSRKHRNNHIKSCKLYRLCTLC